MRLTFAICCLIGLWLVSHDESVAGDSADLSSMPSVGYSLPNANRAQSAVQADQANHADRADHADTADKVRGQSPISPGLPTPGLGVVCGAGASSCGWRRLLPPGTYIVRCGSHPHDGLDYQATVIITKSGSIDWAGCPKPIIGRIGISGRYLKWISRVG